MRVEKTTFCVKTESLDVGYAGETVVANVNFELGPGEALALIGTNGSGKSTLLKTIVGLLPPRQGQVSLFGKPPAADRRRVAYLGQFHRSGFVLPLRAADVVRMGRFPLHGLLGKMGRRDDEIVMDSMQAMGIEKLADSPLMNLSGGQQQRTYLAQVLAHRADLLVLDEPTSGLDAGGRELYLRALQEELRRGASVIVATHDIHEEAALCNRVMLLARKVVAVGPPGEVMTPEALLQTFGVVIGGGQKLHVIESKHGHEL